MAILTPPKKDFVTPSLVAMSPYELYLERVKSISDGIRIQSQGLNYMPAHFGGIKGQQQSLSANAVIKIVNFQVTENGL